MLTSMNALATGRKTRPTDAQRHDIFLSPCVANALDAMPNFLTKACFGVTNAMCTGCLQCQVTPTCRWIGHIVSSLGRMVWRLMLLTGAGS
jgi:hypothetical protein